MKLSTKQLRRLITETIAPSQKKKRMSFGGKTPSSLNDLRTQLADAIEAEGGPEDAVMDLSYLDKTDGQVVALTFELWDTLKNEFFDEPMAGQWMGDAYIQDLVYDLVFDIGTYCSQSKTFSRRPGWQGDPGNLAQKVVKRLGG